MSVKQGLDRDRNWEGKGTRARKRRGCDSRKRAEDRRDRDREREGDRSKRGLLVDRGIGFSVRGVTHPTLTGRLRPFERWPPADQPIRFREVPRAEKARANAPFVWPPRRRTSTRSGFILYFSFFLNFNPPPFSHALPFLWPFTLCSATSPQTVKKFFPFPNTVAYPLLPSFFFPPIGTPRLFFSLHEKSTRETRARSFPVA